ncbi:unnamed protein product [Bursaphelenchus okinawaensis]|uniref:Fatty-acid and retinol-binding protein 1 n=1 Tax=Bursaphelenchus okinawaensis TaxID=465554 RepID=A0A811K8R1_9BILA|nr:unnamed protein product [Bursaphelenchus okinawaensis]CAG9094318.1 unnamed protein product [Bursaphelenchus okinawaensis]
MTNYHYLILLISVLTVLGKQSSTNGTANSNATRIEDEVISLNNSLKDQTLSDLEQQFRQQNASQQLENFLAEFNNNAPNMIKALESRARGDYTTYAQEAAKVFKAFINKYQDLPDADRVTLFQHVPEVDNMLSDPSLLKFVDEFNDTNILKTALLPLLTLLIGLCL